MNKIIYILVALLFFTISCSDPCKDVVCDNGGTCDEGACKCINGYTGSNCQFNEALCEGVNCQNNGECVNGDCNCPLGYRGSLCENVAVPSKIEIKKVDINSFSGNNGMSSWDGTDPYPDLQFTLTNVNTGSLVYTSSQTLDNADPSFTNTFNTNFEILEADLTEPFNLELLDDDNGSNELVGSVILIVYSSTSNDFPSTLTFGQGTSLSVTIHLSYSF